MAMALTILGSGEEIALLTSLPWELPLEQWEEDPELGAQRGISRHVVRLVNVGTPEKAEVFAIKETVPEFAKREYAHLRELANRSAPSVEPIAVVDGRESATGVPLPAIIVTRYLPFSLPYRIILTRNVTPYEIETMGSALSLLLVRLHLLGFWWGDCSLSNTLFRRDGDGFAAYLVDAETGEFQEHLSNGQREHDLEIALFNVAAELDDLASGGLLHPGIDPIRSSEAVVKRYRRLWAMLKEKQELDPTDRKAVERAMRALQDLGFAVEEVEISLDGEKQVLNFQPKLVAPGYHQQRLRELIGLETEELQAKRLLASYDRFRSREEKPRPPREETIRRWLSEVFEKVINQVPDNLKGRVEDAQIFHEVLEHRWYLGEKAGKDVGLDFATTDYMNSILPYRMDSGVRVKS
jgi:hypothetical protein